VEQRNIIRDTCARPIIRSGRKEQKFYPTDISVEISVKLPKNVSDFLFSGECIIRRAFLVPYLPVPIAASRAHVSRETHFILGTFQQSHFN
jgi:hypothetical protein